jgi:hypothetical protein
MFLLCKQISDPSLGMFGQGFPLTPFCFSLDFRPRVALVMLEAWPSEAGRKLKLLKLQIELQPS